jgi:hypothetical protein
MSQGTNMGMIELIDKRSVLTNPYGSINDNYREGYILFEKHHHHANVPI